MNPIDAALVVFGSLLFVCTIVAVGFYSYINNIKKAGRKAKNKIVKI